MNQKLLPEEKSKGASNKNPIRVILADSQAIFRVGLRKIFALESDLKVVAEEIGRASCRERVYSNV